MASWYVRGMACTCSLASCCWFDTILAQLVSSTADKANAHLLNQIKTGLTENEFIVGLDEDPTGTNTLSKRPE
jgi:hypothetical protein